MQNLQGWQPDPPALNGTADEHYRIPLNSRPRDPGNCSSAVSGRPHGLQPGEILDAGLPTVKRNLFIGLINNYYQTERL